jgi:hypothetical protein
MRARADHNDAKRMQNVVDRLNAQIARDHQGLYPGRYVRAADASYLKDPLRWDTIRTTIQTQPKTRLEASRDRGSACQILISYCLIGRTT